MSRPTIVVVAPARDEHARRVVAALRRRGARVVRLDTARFPRSLKLRASLEPGDPSWHGALGSGPDRLAPEDVAAVWWWRPEPFDLDPSLRGRRRDGAFCAASAALAAAWAAPRVRWVNDPVRDQAADEKPRQLALASSLGLAVPRSLVTNDPAAARVFVRERPDGETVHKHVVSVAALWRPTDVARASDRALFASVRRIPLLLQERVRAEADVRATVVGDELYAAEIRSPDADVVDHRPTMRRARFQAVALPAEVERRILRLVRSELGLVYATVDLRRRADGERVFLEVNPGGQWLFVEERTRQPMTEAVAALLAQAAAESAR